jgi:predicted DNA-binding transcriptional regulator AlpA
MKDLTPLQIKQQYIQMTELATQLNCSIATIRSRISNGNFPGEIIREGRNIYFKRKEGEAWVLKEQDETEQKIIKISKQNKDIWCIRTKKDPFVYKGKTLMHILFCQPALRNGKYTYEDCLK